jgi:hypothetical protein
MMAMGIFNIEERLGRSLTGGGRNPEDRVITG